MIIFLAAALEPMPSFTKPEEALLTEPVFMEAINPWFSCVWDKMGKRTVYGFEPERKTNAAAVDKLFEECSTLKTQVVVDATARSKIVRGFEDATYRARIVPALVNYFEHDLKVTVDKQCRFGWCLERMEDGPVATLPHPDDERAD